jgi:CheY-like chemotaxis protein
MDPDQAEQAGRLVKAVESIQNLLLPLQTIMYPPSPKLLQRQLNHLVQQAASQVEAKAHQMGATLELNLEPSLPETAVDAELMVKALTNLLHNGLQAMALSPMKRLRVATRVSSDSLQVVIQDTGPALDEGDQADRFDLANATSTEALGLPIADVIARQHGGSLSSRSQEGLGNAFLLELPCQATPGLPPAAVPVGLKGIRALVVDDETFLLECLVDALGAWGLEVTSSSRGDEAIQRLESGTFDLIVCDIRMPGLSGVDLFDWLKAQRPAMTRRILYTTGDTFDTKTREFLESSQVPYLGKPFDLKQLKQSLERLLETPVEA